MSRFHETPEDLKRDHAMLVYRKGKLEAGCDPAEWIEALHREHWDTLEQLRKAQRVTENDRLAEVLADLQILHRDVQNVLTALGLVGTNLGDVLGDTPMVRHIKELANEQRRALKRLGATIQGQGQ